VPESRPVLAAEAAQHTRGASFLGAHRQRVADRRGKGIAKVATARKIVSLVFYGLRDGEVRCLAEVGWAKARKRPGRARLCHGTQKGVAEQVTEPPGRRRNAPCHLAWRRNDWHPGLPSCPPAHAGPGARPHCAPKALSQERVGAITKP